VFTTSVKATVFLGGGRITNALVAGLRLAKYNLPVIVHDRNPDKLRELKRRYSVNPEADLRRAVDSAELLIVAVRPGSVRELLKEINALMIGRSLTVVSLAAGIPFSALKSGLKSGRGKSVHWVRAMPSPVCRSGRGLTAMAFSRGTPSAKRREIRGLFGLVGSVVEIPEKQFDAFTVTFSSSHGYHALNALMRAARVVGLNSKTARLAAAHALCDGINSWRTGKTSLEKLLQEAATPGGTAAAVMSSLDHAGYQQIISNGLAAGIRRARTNAKS
jgi:pyrroline-5-carboxylate reductase